TPLRTQIQLHSDSSSRRSLCTNVTVGDARIERRDASAVAELDKSGCVSSNSASSGAPMS
ncbi:hypothetical protein, partial [Rhodococcus sp. RS1C4]